MNDDVLQVHTLLPSPPSQSYYKTIGGGKEIEW